MSKFNFILREVQAPPTPTEFPWLTTLAAATAVFGAILALLILKLG